MDDSFSRESLLRKDSLRDEESMHVDIAALTLLCMVPQRYPATYDRIGNASQGRVVQTKIMANTWVSDPGYNEKAPILISVAGRAEAGFDLGNMPSTYNICQLAP